MVRMVPVTPSTSRLFAGTVVPAIQGTWKEALFNAKPEWIKHMERNAVLDGDGIFLHAQSQDLLAGANVLCVHMQACKNADIWWAAT